MIIQNNIRHKKSELFGSAAPAALVETAADGDSFYGE